MSKFDKILSRVILGVMAPIFLFLLGWWGSFPFVTDGNTILFLALGGLAVGILLDFTLLRKFISKLFRLSIFALATVALFYSIMIYGFFMGFPVFNSFVGILGSYIAARNGIIRKLPKEETIKNTKLMNRVSTAILFLLCVCSAALALSDSTICSQIKGMLNLSFDVSMGMIWGLILVGGSFLLLFQYFLSKLVSKRVIKKGYPVS